jgi:acetate kinase
MNGVAAAAAVGSSCDVVMKILVLSAGSSSQKSCLYELKAETPAAPSQPLWEAEIDWTHHRASAILDGAQDIVNNAPESIALGSELAEGEE